MSVLISTYRKGGAHRCSCALLTFWKDISRVMKCAPPRTSELHFIG